MFTIVVTAMDGTISANGLFRKKERADQAADLMRDPFSALWTEATAIVVCPIERIDS